MALRIPVADVAGLAFETRVGWELQKSGLSGFPNAKTLNMTSSYADDGLMGQPRLEENGPLDSWSEAEVWCPIRPAFELESTRG